MTLHTKTQQKFENDPICHYSINATLMVTPNFHNHASRTCWKSRAQSYIINSNNVREVRIGTCMLSVAIGINRGMD